MRLANNYLWSGSIEKAARLLNFLSVTRVRGVVHRADYVFKWDRSCKLKDIRPYLVIKQSDKKLLFQARLIEGWNGSPGCERGVELRIFQLAVFLAPAKERA